jgi:ribonuclease Z
MRPRFHPRLVNSPLEDPGLFVPLAFEKRALLFDIGRIATLSSRDILRISHIFVSHTHMDHFCGLDHLLRLFLGRAKTLFCFGPAGFLANIEGKLAAYNWNLVARYREALQLIATEVTAGGLRQQTYDCRNGFRPQQPARQSPFDPCLLNETSLQVKTAILDHGIPCLGFCLEEAFHINVVADALQALGLDTGPWLQDFKQALYDRSDPQSIIEAPRRRLPGARATYRLGELAERIARITPGQKIAYVTDVAGHEDNRRRIADLARGADHLYIESAFLNEDHAQALAKKHLTAGQAGEIAARAGVKRFTIFHYSPRYTDGIHRFQDQARRAFAQTHALTADANTFQQDVD